MQQARSAMPQKQKKKGGKSKSKSKTTPDKHEDAAIPSSGLPLKSILAAALVAGAATLFSTTRSCGAPRVVEEGDLRYLVNNGGVIGVQRIGAPEQAVFRGWVVQRTASSLRDKARNALVVGLGGGSVAQYWRNTSLSVHAVEIDARVAKLAETHFGVTRGTTLVEEGLRFIRKRADDVRRFRELSAAPGVTFSRRGRLAALFLRSDMVEEVELAAFSGPTAAAQHSIAKL